MSDTCHLCPHVLQDCYRQNCVPGNGHRRLILTANKQMPGPQIRVCEGDTVIVNVTNLMNNLQSTTMHWHGIHQKNTNYMDGVGRLTQCDINQYARWTYRFKADPSGTHWYHSHTGPQRGDGLYGALIVKESKSKLSHLYDFDHPEHVLVLSDFSRTPAIIKVMLYEQNKSQGRSLFDMDFLFINGQGAGEPVTKPTWYTGDDWITRPTPHHRIYVEQGKRYRLRLISNSLFNCPIEVFIQQHNFTVIATDGAPIKPRQVNLLVLAGGERWDIVIHTNMPVDNYWLYARGISGCTHGGDSIQQTAILSYKGANSTKMPSGNIDASSVRNSVSDWLVVNPFDDGIIDYGNTDQQISLSELSSQDSSIPQWIERLPDHKFYLGFDVHVVENDLTNTELSYKPGTRPKFAGKSLQPQVNRISGMLPDHPYLTQIDQIHESRFCTYDSTNHSYVPTECMRTACYCTHRLRVRTGDVVEMILIDEGKRSNRSNHAVHLHGMYWTVLSVGQDPSRMVNRSKVIAMDEAGAIVRNYTNPINKDTIMLPNGGWVVTKFVADNPGVWFLHCHNEVHASRGMNVILQIGRPEEWPLLDNLPKCGSYHYSDFVSKVKDRRKSAEDILIYSFFILCAFFMFYLLLLFIITYTC